MSSQTNVAAVAAAGSIHPADHRRGGRGIGGLLTLACRFVLAVVLALGAGAAAQAGTTYSWTGTGGNNKWSTHANWTPSGTPINGDSVVFPAGPTNLSTDNDLPDGTSLKAVVLTGSGYTLGTLGGNRIVLTGMLSSAGDGNIVSVPIDVQTNAVTINGGGHFTLNGALAGSGPITLTGANARNTYLTLGSALGGTHTYSGTLSTTYTSNGAYLVLNGASLLAASIAVGSNTFLSGNGTIGALTVSPNGHMDPGANDALCCQNGSSGRLNTGNLTLNLSDLYFDINGTAAGTGYDQINVTGTVALGTSTQLNLTMDAGFVPALNAVYTLIANAGSVTGTFKDLPEATVIKLNGAEFELSYAGGHVTLTCTVAPRAWTGSGTDSKWSTPANWSPSGVPATGDSLAFPANAARLSNINDLTGRSFRALALNGSGYTLGTLDGTTGIVLTHTLSSSGDNNVVSVPIDVQANAVTINGGGHLTLNGALAGSGPITLTGANANNIYLTLGAALLGTHTYSGTLSTTYTNNAAYLVLDGASLTAASMAVGSNTFLSGNGTIGALTVSPSGRIDAGLPNAISAVYCCRNGTLGIVSAGSLTLDGGNLYFDINGAVAGTGYDQINVTGTGTIALGTSTQLNLTMGADFVPAVGDVYTLIANTGSVTGTFKDLAEATVIKLNGAEFQIGYAGGHVTLTCMVAPRKWTGSGTDIKWSTPANWSPSGVPATGDSLAFPATAARLSNNNDLTGRSFKALALNGSGYTLAGNVIVLTETLSSAGESNVVSLPIDVQTNAVTISGGGHLTLAGALSGSGPIVSTEHTLTTLGGTGTYSGTLGTNCPVGAPPCGYLVLNGASLPSASVANGSILLGNGTIGPLTSSQNLSPSAGTNTEPSCCGNDGTGIIHSGNLTLNGGIFYADINGATAGTGYDQINVNGTVALGTTTELRLSKGAGFVPTAGQVFTLIANNDSDTVTGTFNGAPEGTVITVDGAYRFALSYAGGTAGGAGNNVTLTSISGNGTQTIAFTSSAPGAATVGGTYTVTATGGASGNPVTFTIDASASSVCSIAGSLVSINAAGNCVIDANQAGNDTYNAATQVQQSFAVNPGSQTINFTSTAPVNAVVVGATYSPAASATSGLAVTITVAATAASVCSISGGGVVSFTAAGSCVLNANQSGNGSFNAAPQVQQTFTVGKGSQTVSFGTPAPLNAVAGGTNYLPTASATSGLQAAITVDASATTACSITGAGIGGDPYVVSFAAVGTCKINANQAGNADYNPAAQQQQSFAVGPATNNIRVERPALAMPSPTMADAVTYTLTFNSPVNAVPAANLEVVTTGGINGASIGTISGSGTTWTVTVNNTGHGVGTLVLNVKTSSGIGDSSGHTLGGTPVQGFPYDLDKGGTVSGGGQGQPDTAFDIDGYAVFNVTQGLASPGAIAVRTSGKILVAGGIACDAEARTNCTLQLMQYLANGAADSAPLTGFAPTGRVITSITGINADLAALIVNSDGTFFVAGSRTSGGNTTPFVAKFTVNGALVSTYGTGGLANLGSVLLSSAVMGATIDATGRVIVAGTKPTAALVGTDVLVARVTTAGVLDPTFGSSGLMSYGVSSTDPGNDFASDVVIQPNGLIVVGGRALGPSGYFDFMLLRINGNGAVDNGFGTLGRSTARFAGSTGDNNGRKLVLQPDGKIVLVGSVQLDPLLASTMKCGVARFNGNGTPDASFGTTGQVLIPLNQGCLGVTLQPDGKLIVTAQDRMPLNGDVTFATLARMLPTGAPDTSFGTGGAQDISSHTGATEVAVTAGGKLLSGLTRGDPTDGIQRSFVVQLTSQLSPSTTTTITSISPSPALTGHAYSVSVTVTAASGTPTGTVTVTDGTLATCTITLAAGGGSCPLTSTTAGTKTVTANYNVTDGYQASVGTKAQVVNASTTATALAASAAVLTTTPVTFTATVTGTSAGANTPTGTVTFNNGNTALGTAPLNGVGVATLTLPTLAAGNYNVTATYNAADTNYFKTSTSAKVAVQVQALPTLQFSATSVNVADTAGTLTLTVKRVGSTLGAVSVHYASADGTAKAGTDYTATSGTLNWVANDGANKTFTVPIRATPGTQVNRAFTVTLSLPSSGATLGNPATETVTVQK